MKPTTSESLPAPEPQVKFRLPIEELTKDQTIRVASDPDQMLSAAGVAKLLDCSTRTVTRLEDAGDMPASVRINSLKRWPRSVLVAWIQSGCPKRRATKGGRRR